MENTGYKQRRPQRALGLTVNYVGLTKVIGIIVQLYSYFIISMGEKCCTRIGEIFFMQNVQLVVWFDRKPSSRTDYKTNAIFAVFF